MTEAAKTPVLFWVIGAIALIWNVMGVAAYLSQAFMTPEQFAALSPAEQDLVVNRPFWVTAAFALSVFSGVAGSIMLLLRRRIAVRLFLLSLVAVIVQFASFFIIQGTTDHLSGADWILPIMVPVLAIGFWLYARNCEEKGLLT